MLKRVTSFMMAMICAFSFIFICPLEIKTNAANFFTGSGTREDPYQISSKNDLKKLAELCNTADANKEYKLAYYIQTADIDLENESWTPIGNHYNGSVRWEGYKIFGGVYDGKGHTISGLNVSGGYAYAGLFGRIGTDLQADCRIENIIVKGTVSPTADSAWTDGAAWVGGIVGEIGSGAAVSNCSFIGAVSGLKTECVIGGIVGKVCEHGNIYNCNFIGDLKNTEHHSIAGIVANIGSGSTTGIYNCYATGTLNANGSPYCGGIVGNTGNKEANSTVKIVNCYYSTEFAEVSIRTDEWSGVTEINDSHMISESEMKSKMADLLGESFSNDVNNINNGFPVHVYETYSLKGLGTKENPYQISSKADLFYMSDAVNSRVGYDQYYIQTTDINLENDIFTPIGTYTDYNLYWGPGMGFQGCYDGNQKYIYNFNVKRSGIRQNYCGLFGWVYGLAGTSYVKDVVIFGNVESETGDNVGGIVGELGSAEISGCAFIGDIKGKISSGGVVGAVWQGNPIIRDCYYNGNVTSTSRDGYAGGILGRASSYNTAKATLINCYSVGTVKKSGSSTNIGAIIGGFEGETTSSNVITSNCYFSSASTGNAVNQNTYNGCTSVKDNVLRSCADKLGSPFVNSDNENFNAGYPVFNWQKSEIPIKNNVSSGFKGKGTAENPYQISSAKDLNRLSELINDESTNPLFRHAYYIQTADIDLNNGDFTPIGIYYGINGTTTSSAIFAGNYDGDYHSIKNLDISYSNQYCGLFGRVGEYNYDNTNCEIKNLSVSGSVECYSDAGRTGGIIGELTYGATIKNCDYHGLVSSNGKVGSIVGSVFCGGTISSCYSDANVYTSDDKSSTGGIIGEISVGNNAATGSTNAKIERTYYNGTISSNNASATGAICGKINEYDGNSVDFTTNFFLSSSFNGSVANTSISGCTKLSPVAMKACADMIGSPYIPNNNLKLNNGYPVFEWQSTPYQFKGTGTEENPYKISSKTDLENLRNLINSSYYNKIYSNSYFVQTTDIDLENESWIPIASSNSNQTFKGVYDGACHYIYGLNIDTNFEYSGLFGMIDSAYIHDIVVNGNITQAGNSSGGVAGIATNGSKLEKCAFVGDISAKSSGGGIVGILKNGSNVTSCYHNGIVNSDSYAGGLIGSISFDDNINESSITVRNCYQANGVVNGKKYSGCMVGKCDSSLNSVSILNCFATIESDAATNPTNVSKDNTLIITKSMLKKSSEDLGECFVDNTDSKLNNGYPVFVWQVPSNVRGDVNNNGTFEIADVVMMQKWLLGSGVLTNWENGDLCKDNRIDVFDLCLMKSEIIYKL